MILYKQVILVSIKRGVLFRDSFIGLVIKNNYSIMLDLVMYVSGVVVLVPINHRRGHLFSMLNLWIVCSWTSCICHMEVESTNIFLRVLMLFPVGRRHFL